MTWLLAIVAGVGVFLIVAPPKPTTLAVCIEPYLAPRHDQQETRKWPITLPSGGLAAVVAGMFIGILGSQGDLFIAGKSRSAIALGVLGGAAGWVVWSMRKTNRRERRARTLRYELPVVADVLSLYIVAGESVNGAIRSIVSDMRGVTPEEFAAVLSEHDSGQGLPESLATAARVTAHPDAIRLYETLSHAHTTGGHLAEALGDLAIDYRAGLERDLTSEGGKRAIATYGPVLALMVPTALIFLIYPTLLGLRALSGAP